MNIFLAAICLLQFALMVVLGGLATTHIDAAKREARIARAAEQSTRLEWVEVEAALLDQIDALASDNYRLTVRLESAAPGRPIPVPGTLAETQ